MITPAQRATFFRLFAAAWEQHVAAAGQDPADAPARDAYRRRLIREATGADSLRFVSRTRGYDRLLQHVAIQAGDYARAAHVAVSQAQRIRARCEDSLRQISEIDGAAATHPDPAHRWAYIAAILRHAYQSRPWLDIPEDDLENVFRMLDTHRRRLLRRAGWGLQRSDPAHPLGYAYGRRYTRTARAVTWTDDAPQAPEVQHAG